MANDIKQLIIEVERLLLHVRHHVPPEDEVIESVSRMLAKMKSEQGMSESEKN